MKFDVNYIETLLKGIFGKEEKFEKKRNIYVPKKPVKRDVRFVTLIYLCRNSPAYMRSGIHKRIEAKHAWLCDQMRILHNMREVDEVRAKLGTNE